MRTLGCVATFAGAAIAIAATADRDFSARSAETGSSDPAAVVRALTRPARSTPVAIRDVNAAKLVVHSGWEPRPQNREANQHRASEHIVERLRRRSDLPLAYTRRVTGAYRGTTDEILQWGAHKWGFSPDLFRAVAVIESWWNMSTVGDGGRSFGIMQIKRGYHCCLPATQRSTAYNVDYYGAWLRAVYDGRRGWLNEVERGARYRRGDLWGSVGTWFSGRWHLGSSDYIRRVKNALTRRTWRSADFRLSG